MKKIYVFCLSIMFFTIAFGVLTHPFLGYFDENQSRIANGLLLLIIGCTYGVFMSFFGEATLRKSLENAWPNLSINAFNNVIQFLMFLVISSAIIVTIGGFCIVYMGLGIIDTADSKPYYGFRECLYYSLVTWTTLGYGDFKPSEGARFYAASEAVIGYIYMAILVARLASFSKQNSSNKALQRTSR